MRLLGLRLFDCVVVWFVLLFVVCRFAALVSGLAADLLGLVVPVVVWLVWMLFGCCAG